MLHRQVILFEKICSAHWRMLQTVLSDYCVADVKFQRTVTTHHSQSPSVAHTLHTERWHKGNGGRHREYFQLSCFCTFLSLSPSFFLFFLFFFFLFFLRGLEKFSPVAIWRKKTRQTSLAYFNRLSNTMKFTTKPGYSIYYADDATSTTKELYCMA